LRIALFRSNNIFFVFDYQAGYIAETLTLAALQGRKNVLQDGSLRDHAWHQIYFRRLKKEFPQFRQAIIHITAPRQAVLDRAAVSVPGETSIIFRIPDKFALIY